MCSFLRHSTLAILFIFIVQHARTQTNRCDSMFWNFDVNQFAIDGDNLLADFAEKGWTEQFFQTNEIDVTIYGATDCPGTYEYNSKLAGYRERYLRNYFEVSAFPKLTIANSYTIPERNCVKPGQGYNRADRVTALKVCWVGAAPAIVESITNQSGTNRENPQAVISSKENVGEGQGEVVQTKVQSNTENPVTEVIVPKEESPAKEQLPVAVMTEIVATDSTQGEPLVEPEVADSLTQSMKATDKLDSLVEAEAINTASTSLLDSINIAILDSTVVLPSKPKKILDVESTPEINAGDELIIDGLNFYPGSHRTLPEAKPVLKKLTQVMQQNPTLKIEIQGHVCCASKPNEDGLDDETGDFKLSWNRAQYVRDYLIQSGIDQSRITYRGFAMTRPLVYPEKTIQDQIKNRRVEILITAE